ncbi:dTDP-4-dehydrorhamnose reductase [Azonexus hydrophilus]|uniref:dTDP-4-dehydrorhamnose reductase n=1 Tax=Azonexus hydrophilus TaxID=418702 RepID=A0A1R1I8Z7_9RHOO|nr:dTDP-4-dehydrorhamnose reductase [Azonexus hydrophilus]OMG55090.1 dTDP-4-dehydrorhamnose reductase [Azonexus hydrophilus]
MTILLLGKDGQVGWQLQRALAPLGPVRACARADCDLADPAQIRSLVETLRPSVIVNATAYTAVDKAESEPALAAAINTEAPRLLALAAKDCDALLVHYSTDYVYDGTKDGVYVESDPTAPQSVYGRTKLAGEEAIRAVGGKSLIFRTSWVFGEHGGNFVKTILRLARDKEALNVVADQTGSPTPAALIADVSATVLASLACGRRLGAGENRLYHLAAANPVSWYDFARRIVDLARSQGAALRLDAAAIKAITTAEYPTPARRPANSRLDCSRLEADFDLLMPDWQPYLERMLQVCLPR